ncbi:hypothetical protein NMY22_g9322 [Coprinellus aureogranulatus]|nr:hypothetical protein NMY22_g9322 [Coprinellus aureogranulatus]
MDLSDEQILALADAVAMWRVQEVGLSSCSKIVAQCMTLVQAVNQSSVPFYAFYVYYVLTTLDEEVAITFPQKWNRGKMLLFIIRYGTVVFIAFELSRNYRDYLVVSPSTCKGWLIAYDALFYLVAVSCDAVLALCLGALLQVNQLYLLAIFILSIGPRIIGGIFSVVSDIQYPAEPVSDLDREMGYPCYLPSNEIWVESTIWGNGRDIRSYVNFAGTAVLFLLAGATMILRYKGHNGQLIKVLRRDGGLYYLVLAGTQSSELSIPTNTEFHWTFMAYMNVGMRFGQAITRTPAIVAVFLFPPRTIGDTSSDLYMVSSRCQGYPRPPIIVSSGSHMVQQPPQHSEDMSSEVAAFRDMYEFEKGSELNNRLLNISSDVVTPILAQRLMINLRKADYMGSRPIASKLLFAPPLPGAEDDEDHQDQFETSTEDSPVRHRAGEQDPPGC